MSDIEHRIASLPTFTFGDSRDLCDELLALVRSGQKTGTCFPVSEVGGDEVMPVVGVRSVALDWDRNPALMIETTDVRICRFQDVDEAFALSEGEDDSLEGWRAGHGAYFRRRGIFSEDMELVCERFVMVENFGARR